MRSFFYCRIMENWLKSGSFKRKCNEVTEASEPTDSMTTSSVGEDENAQQTPESPSHPSCSTSVREKGTHYQKEIRGKIRKYDPSYLTLYGFVRVGNEQAPEGQCVNCHKIVANGCLVPSKLKRHLECNHSGLVDKGEEIFKRRALSLQAGSSMMERVCKNENENATEASFIVSLHIAKAGKPHTIAEELIKPCVKDVVTCMLGSDMAKKFDTVQLSNSTISKRIYTISEFVENELISRLKTCEFFSLQLDESTDVAGLAVLLVFVRYPFEMKIEEELLMSEELESYATGDEIFKAIDEYVQKNDLKWSKCVDICSDGAAAMVGKVKGAVSRMKQVAENATSSHCVIHRHSLATRRMPQDLKFVLDGAVKIINHVKSRPLQARLLKLTAEDLGMDHFHLLLHTEVRWLSRGKILARLFELKDALMVTFTEKSFIQELTDVDWLLKLGYLADIFEIINKTTTSLQGKGGAQLDKIKALRKIVTFFKACVESRDISNFPRLQEFVKTNEINLQTNFFEIVIAHLQGLEESVVNYFPDIDSDDIYSWVMNPFSCDPKHKPTGMTNEVFQNLLEISEDSSLKYKYREESQEEFWMQVYSENNAVGKVAVKRLVRFTSTYLCESSFSTYAYIKNKYRSKLKASKDLRVKLTKLPINIKEIMKKSSKQFHSSH